MAQNEVTIRINKWIGSVIAGLLVTLLAAAALSYVETRDLARDNQRRLEQTDDRVMRLESGRYSRAEAASDQMNLQRQLDRMSEDISYIRERVDRLGQ